MSKKNLKPKKYKEWQPCDAKILLSYHKSGYTVKEVAKRMGLDITRVRNKGFLMGVVFGRVVR